jgi:hypothetical protein
MSCCDIWIERNRDIAGGWELFAFFQWTRCVLIVRQFLFSVDTSAGTGYRLVCVVLRSKDVEPLTRIALTSRSVVTCLYENTASRTWKFQLFLLNAVAAVRRVVRCGAKRCTNCVSRIQLCDVKAVWRLNIPHRGSCFLDPVLGRPNSVTSLFMFNSLQYPRLL